VAIDWLKELTDQLEFHWQMSLMRRLEGLTDAEYFWEPVAGCWTIRPAGDGRFTYDERWPSPDPPPFTTIAWRIGHIAGSVLERRITNHFGAGNFGLADVQWPGTAADAIAMLEDRYASWKAGVQSLGNEGLARAVGPAEGRYAEHPYATLILHINREVIHHAAEIGVLRDLYRDRASWRPTD
jgi:hypothetical protein